MVEVKRQCCGIFLNVCFLKNVRRITSKKIFMKREESRNGSDAGFVCFAKARSADQLLRDFHENKKPMKHE